MNTCDNGLCRCPADVLDDNFVNNLLDVLLIAASAPKARHEHWSETNALFSLSMLPKGQPRDRIHVVLQGNAAIWVPKNEHQETVHIVDNIHHKTSLFSSLVTSAVDSSVDTIYIDTRLKSELTSCGGRIEDRIWACFFLVRPSR